MRKISKIFLLVGGIYAIVCAFSFVICSIIFFAGMNPALADYLKELLARAGAPDPDKIVALILGYSILLGVLMLISAIVCIPSAVVAFKAQKTDEPTKKILVVNIILGYLSGSFYNMVGGIIGLIQNGREERRAKKEQAKVVDAQ